LQLAKGKHTFLKKLDENFPAATHFYLIENFRLRKFTLNFAAGKH